MKHFIGTREVVENLVPRYATGRTVDIGAGRGRYRKFISQQVSEYVTTDLDAYDGVDYVEDATSMSFLDESFDTVLSFQTLEHIREPDRAVSEMYRILKRGGRCIVSVPFLVPEHARPTDFQRYTVHGLKTLFENNAFSIIECDSYGGLYSVIAESIKWLLINPANGKSYGRVRRKIAHWAVSFFNYLEVRHPSKTEIFYANSYLVAKK